MVPTRANILENLSAHRLENGISSNFKIVNALHGQPLSNIKQYLLDHNVALQLRLKYFAANNRPAQLCGTQLCLCWKFIFKKLQRSKRRICNYNWMTSNGRRTLERHHETPVWIERYLLLPCATRRFIRFIVSFQCSSSTRRDTIVRLIIFRCIPSNYWNWVFDIGNTGMSNHSAGPMLATKYLSRTCRYTSCLNNVTLYFAKAAYALQLRLRNSVITR